MQEISVSQCTSAYHCLIKNSSFVVGVKAASSVARESGGGGGGGGEAIAPSLACRPKCTRKIPSTSETVLCTGMD